MALQHVISAKRIVPLPPDAQVFGDAKTGYYVITPYEYGSHWRMTVVDSYAEPNRITNILTRDAEALLASGAWKAASEIWPDKYVEVKERGSSEPRAA